MATRANAQLLVGVRPDGHLEPATCDTLVLLWQGWFVILLATAVVLWRVYRRRGARAEDAYKPEVRLRMGETVVHGTVEHAAESNQAVRVEVEQEGSESESSGVWSYSWREKDRRVQVTPFYLRCASGERVRVEPAPETVLVDDMDGVIRVNRVSRIRFAELLPGERVFAVGRLAKGFDPEARGSGYRGAPQGLVLGPPRRGPMLLSTEPLGRRFRRRAGMHALWAVAIGLLCAACNVFFAGYYLRRSLGVTGAAHVTGLRTYKTQTDDGEVEHYAVRLRGRATALGDEVDFEDEVARPLYRRLTVGRELPIRIVPSCLTATRVGAGATYHGALLLIPILVLFTLSLLYSIFGRRPLAWYEKGRFNEGGRGRLGEG